jgi:hypothetical protein
VDIHIGAFRWSQQVHEVDIEPYRLGEDGVTGIDA